MSNEKTIELKVSEGISGLWHYHLSKPETPTRGLCGAQVMRTSIALQDWKVPFGDHFPKRPTWCSVCDEEMDVSTNNRKS